MHRLGDIIVALSLSELLAQGEGSKTLEFLREFLGSVGSERPRALPAELVEGVGFAHLVVLLLHHVQHVALSRMGWHLAVGVVGADDVQIVVDAHFHRVIVHHEVCVGAVPVDAVSLRGGEPSTDAQRQTHQKHQIHFFSLSAGSSAGSAGR